jgi:hypothetical protein
MSSRLARRNIASPAKAAPVPELLQSTIHGGYRHTKRFSQLNKTNRCGKCIALRQARETGTIEQLAKQVIRFWSRIRQILPRLKKSPSAKRSIV